LLATFAVGFGPLPSMRICAQGFGAGDKEFAGQANVLRVLIGEETEAAESISVTVLEANIDDSTPQTLGYAMERLFEAGALDVTFAPIFMKKNRPATLLSAIAPPELSEQIAAILFAETTTLGVRVFQAERRVLARKMADVETPFGKIRIKYTEAGNFAPEYEDCRTAARQSGKPLRDVIEAAAAAFRRQRTVF
ncbi:MAG: LarC family nickel insertion protein, partial [Rhodanobacteraceae bacterium]